ncbi:9326_t:CDS:2, partial [Acaulospora colombiana]
NEEGQNGSALLDVVRASKATVLIGTSTHAGAFTEEVVKAMSKNNKHPIIMPLSNPSRLVEVEPKDALKWSEGKALIATALKSHQGESGERGEVNDSEGNLPPLLPDFGEAPEVNFEVALAVAKVAMDEGLANVDFGPEELRERAEAIRWTPAYPA